MFDIPGTIDGKKVSDAFQRTTMKTDPGDLQFAAFDSGGNMLLSFSAWLTANGYIFPHELDMPDFFPDPSSGLDEVFYGVNTAALLSSGESFINANSFGDTFIVSMLEADLQGRASRRISSAKNRPVEKFFQSPS